MFIVNKKTFLLGFVLTTQSVFANTNSIINQAIQYRDKVTHQSTNSFADIKQSSLQATKNYSPLINSIHKQQTTNSSQHKIKSAPEVVIFASFSLPKLLLQKLVEDGARYDIPVVMRGLYKNSFQETAKKIYAIVKQKNKGGILVDPIWFREFAIKTVPALVVQNFSTHKYDIIYGNLNTERALKIIAEKGDAASVARQILDNVPD